MKKILIAAIFLIGCNSTENLDEVKREVSLKVPEYLKKYTLGGLMLSDCKIYKLDKITGMDAVKFRIEALSDSLIIQKNMVERYKRTIEQKKIDMKELDSMKVSTTEIKKLITRYVYLTDSTNMASIQTKKTFDSLSSLKNTSIKNSEHYNGEFSICTLNITSASTCDSFAFLFDNNLNIISLHAKK